MAVAVTLVLMALALVGELQRRLIYLPGAQPVPPAARILPGALDVDIDTADGLRLRAWFVPVRRANATVLVCNGNGGDRSDRAPLAAVLAAAGLSVLLLDYRGYGGNPGTPSERGLAQDARAARRYLLSRADVDPDSLVYLGESLGAAVALELAVAHPPAALVLRSPFTSLTDVGRLHYPFLPVRALLIDRYESLGRVRALRAPLLIVAGGRDRIVPASQSRALYDAAPQPKRYLEIPNADHNDEELLAGQQLVSAVTASIGTTVTTNGVPRRGGSSEEPSRQR